jgi:hypothetical protein
MNKLFLLLTTFIFCQSSFALHFEIRGKKQVVSFASDIKPLLPRTLGDITIDVLDKNAIAYEGSSEGLSSLMGLGNDMEVLSDQEMKAYGWCFSLDGQVLDTMSNETLVIDQQSSIVWFYAFAHFKDGHWIKQCSPSL